MRPTQAHVRHPVVLLVEDDLLISDVLAEVLEDAGYAVLAVTAAEDALGLAVMDAEFDALITDIGLAGMLDGWDLAETLREMRPGLPVVYASGSANGAGRGVQGAVFVPKPYDPLAVCALVDRLIVAAACDALSSPPTSPPAERPRAALRLIA